MPSLLRIPWISRGWSPAVGVVDEGLSCPRNNKFPDAALLVNGRGVDCIKVGRNKWEGEERDSGVSVNVSGP